MLVLGISTVRTVRDFCALVSCSSPVSRLARVVWLVSTLTELAIILFPVAGMVPAQSLVKRARSVTRAIRRFELSASVVARLIAAAEMFASSREEIARSTA